MVKTVGMEDATVGAGHLDVQARRRSLIYTQPVEEAGYEDCDWR